MMKRTINTSTGEWAESEFGIVNFGDIRLSKRLLKIVNSFAESPECSINQACEDWHQSKHPGLKDVKVVTVCDREADIYLKLLPLINLFL